MHNHSTIKGQCSQDVGYFIDKFFNKTTHLPPNRSILFDNRKSIHKNHIFTFVPLVFKSEREHILISFFFEAYVTVIFLIYSREDYDHQ